MKRHDRHGRLVAGDVASREDWLELDTSQLLKDIDRIAKRIYVDRNAQGMPQKYRALIREQARPWFREAAAFARDARAAILRGDRPRFELDKSYAHQCLERVQAIFRQPFMDRYRKAAEGGKRGGRPPSEHDGDWLKMFNARKALNPDQSQSAICKWISARWKGPEGETRTWRAIEEGIKRARK